MSYFENGYSVVSLDDEKYGVIDVNGNTIIPFNYHKITYYVHDNEVEVETFTEDDIITETIKLK